VAVVAFTVRESTLDWTMIGAIGEIVGAGAVVVTLAYLAVQIRQGAAASRQEAVRELMDQTSTTLSWLSHSPERADLWSRGMAGEASLSVGELGQFRALLMQLVLIWQRMHFLDEAANVDAWFTTYIATIRREMVGTPGFRSWYEVRGHWLHPEFKAVVEAEMQSGSTYRPMGVETEQAAGGEDSPRSTVA